MSALIVVDVQRAFDGASSNARMADNLDVV